MTGGSTAACVEEAGRAGLLCLKCVESMRAGTGALGGVQAYHTFGACI